MFCFKPPVNRPLPQIRTQKTILGIPINSLREQAKNKPTLIEVTKNSGVYRLLPYENSLHILHKFAIPM